MLRHLPLLPLASRQISVATSLAPRLITRRCYAQVISLGGLQAPARSAPRHSRAKVMIEPYFIPLKPNGALCARHPYLRPQFASANPSRCVVGSQRFYSTSSPTFPDQALFAATRASPTAYDASAPLQTLRFSQIVGVVFVYGLLTIWWSCAIWFVMLCMWAAWQILKGDKTKKSKGNAGEVKQIAKAPTMSATVLAAVPSAGAAIQEETVLAKVADVTARIARFIV